MYITNNLFNSSATYINLDDIDVFNTLIDIAIDNYEKLANLDENLIAQIKSEGTIVLYSSYLSPKGKTPNFVLRKELNSDKARRKFLMLDVDFNPGEETLSQQLYDNLITFAEKYNTPLIIYPTISYPTKPRFRAVLFTKTAMNETQYYKGIKWLSRELDYEITDTADFRLHANKNAPIFTNKEQVEYIYNNTNKENLEPLDNKYWKNETAPSKASANKYIKANQALLNYKLPTAVLLQGAKKYATTTDAQNYDTFWQVVQALAISVIVKQTNEEDALKALNIMAEAAGDDILKSNWIMGNRELYFNTKNRILNNPDIINKSKPLLLMNGFHSAYEEALPKILTDEYNLK